MSLIYQNGREGQGGQDSKSHHPPSHRCLNPKSPVTTPGKVQEVGLGRGVFAKPGPRISLQAKESQYTWLLFVESTENQRPRSSDLQRSSVAFTWKIHQRPNVAAPLLLDLCIIVTIRVVLSWKWTLQDGESGKTTSVATQDSLFKGNPTNSSLTGQKKISTCSVLHISSERTHHSMVETNTGQWWTKSPLRGQ